MFRYWKPKNEHHETTDTIEIGGEKSLSSLRFSDWFPLTTDFATIFRGKAENTSKIKKIHSSATSKASLGSELSRLVSYYFDPEINHILHEPNIPGTIFQPRSSLFEPISSESIPQSFIIPISSSPLLKSLTIPRTHFPKSSSTIDAVSPVPLFSYSPNLEVAQRQFTMKQVCEELIHSEENYICGLKLVRNYYIEPLFINTKMGNPIPILSMYQCLLDLIKNHIIMLNKIKIIQSNQNIYQYVNDVCFTIVNSIKPFYYEEYLKFYNITLKVIATTQDNRENKWFKGWRNYLEFTQPNSRMDLSFLSLLQRPISRISKYRLLIESLIKNCDEQYQFQLKLLLKIMKQKLEIINETSQTFQDQILNLKINKLINFEPISDKSIRCLEYFGLPLLIGSITFVYINEGNPVVADFATILYKSHLLLMKTKQKGKLVIDFILDLSKCSMIKNYRDNNGGIYMNYALAFKVQYEHGNRQFELQLIFVNRQEYQIWFEMFDLLINFVNGPYPMNYTRKNDKSLTIFPKTLSNFDILIGSNEQTEFYNCYFKRIIVIEIIGLNDSPIHDISVTKLRINKKERLINEMKLSSIWSSKLPISKAPSNLKNFLQKFCR